jgi:hypothetical protein
MLEENVKVFCFEWLTYATEEIKWQCSHSEKTMCCKITALGSHGNSKTGLRSGDARVFHGLLKAIAKLIGFDTFEREQFVVLEFQRGNRGGIYIPSYLAMTPIFVVHVQLSYIEVT